MVDYQRSRQKPGTQLLFAADIEGDAVANAMAVTNFTVIGVTGKVQFEAGIGGIPDYGWGDRSSGVRYSVVNYQYNTSNVKGVFQRVGTWSTEHKWVSLTFPRPNLIYHSFAYPLESHCMPPLKSTFLVFFVGTLCDGFVVIGQSTGHRWLYPYPMDFP